MRTSYTRRRGYRNPLVSRRGNPFCRALVVNVVPVGGGEPIHVAGAECHCRPVLREGVLVHSAHDQRERLEQNGVTHDANSWVLINSLEPL